MFVPLNKNKRVSKRRLNPVSMILLLFGSETERSSSMSSSMTFPVSQAPPAFSVLLKLRTIDLFVEQVQLSKVLLYVNHLKFKPALST